MAKFLKIYVRVGGSADLTVGRRYKIPAEHAFSRVPGDDVTAYVNLTIDELRRLNGRVDKNDLH